ncbi:hypothetical protein SNE40_019287 [Patella caerulea]|uniref:Follistatin-related protein 5 n=2 Tax=Patella caerulea TaxID=87958 RepID=A0AAN8J6T5_PATCE
MREEMFLWGFVLVVVAVSSATEAKPSQHKEQKHKHWWDKDWTEWFPEEKETSDSSHTNNVPDYNSKKSKHGTKKDSDFSFDKSLSLKDDVESFLDDDKKSFLKKEEKSEKDWHAEFQQPIAFENKEDEKVAENEIESKKKLEDDQVTQNVKEYQGLNSYDSIVPEKDQTKDEKKKTESKEISYVGYPVYHTKHESVKKDLENPVYLKDFTNTKPDLKTSPNPPPPGYGEGKIPMVTPAGKKPATKKDYKKVKTYIESKPAAFCKHDMDCRMGRMCHQGVCMCLPNDGCLKHNHPVCGSDGSWYPSHCELHRTACIHRIHIKVDRSNLCLKSDEDTPAITMKPKFKKPSSIDAPVDPKLPAGAIIDSKEIFVGSYKKNHVNSADDKESWKNGVNGKDKGSVDGTDKGCNLKNYNDFKEKLLTHHCARFAEPDCKSEVSKQKDREYLATLIFSYYDRDIDYYLEKSELYEIEKKEDFGQLDNFCSLPDMLLYDDVEPNDNKISVNEFLKAFDKSGKSGKKVDVQIIPTLATAGNGLELKCAIPGAEDIVWKRYESEIGDNTDQGLAVFDDGSLFFSTIGVHHIGNYSCFDRKNNNFKQVHVLKVQMPPVVQVSPMSQMRQSKSDITVKCHAEGIPRPVISWNINEMPLPHDPDHFIQSDDNETLTIRQADYQRDTGAYKCVAKNQAGIAEDVASIFIEDMSHSKIHTSSQKSFGTFLVFHSRGYTAYQPQSCLMRREVRGKFGNFKFIPDNLDSPLTLCPNSKCDWGMSVNVKNQFVFISQPSQNRVVVIETSRKWNPIQVIDTDRQPIGLYYIPHLDQVWVLCWNGRDDGSMKTIVVIRDASQEIQHHSVHTQPVGNRFDLVEQIFMPPQNDLNHHFNFGYIVHAQQRGLFKLDLVEMKYVKVIDFSHFDCIPKSVAFVPIGGHVVVECVVPSTRKTLQIVVDYITDAIVSHLAVPGRPVVSPDSRHVVTVDFLSGKISVSNVTPEGMLEMGFEVIVSTSISDVEFFPSSERKGYDFVMSSADTENIIILSLNNGKVEKIKGTHKVGGDSMMTPSHMTRTVVSGGVFGDYLLTPFDSTISIIDGKHHHVKCEFKGTLQSNGIVFVEN